MPRPLKFSIHSVTINGRKLYRIWLPARFSKNGKKTALYYKTRAEAREDQIKLIDKFMNGVIAMETTLTTAQLNDISRAYRLIAQSGLSLTLVDAVATAVERGRARLQGILIKEFLIKYRDSVAEARNWSNKQHANWKFYANKFESAFGGINISDVHHHAIRDWLQQNFASATYFNSALSVIAPSFTWAVRQELIEKSPFDLIERRRMVKSDSIDVFTVNEAKNLLKACRSYKNTEDHPVKNADGTIDPGYKLDCGDALVPFAFLLFAGIRPDELAKLTWDNVRTEEKFIHIVPSVAKTNQVRHISIPDNLDKFIQLIPLSQKKGLIVPRNWKRKAYLVRKAAGLEGRPDAARHSYASYTLALDPDTDKLKENMGHTKGSDILFKHYRAAVTKKDAKDYFSISPGTML